MHTKEQGWIRRIKELVFDSVFHKWGVDLRGKHRWVLSIFLGPITASLLWFFIFLSAQCYWPHLCLEINIGSQQGSLISQHEELVISNKKSIIPINLNTLEQELVLGSLSTDVDNLERLILLEGEERGLLGSVNNDLDPLQTKEITFIPTGDKVINLVIDNNDFYQLTVGDNDFQTVTLKARTGIDEPLKSIKEVEQLTTRPRLAKPIDRGTKVRVSIFERNYSDHQHSVEVKVEYLYEGNFSQDRFLFEFSPIPTWDAFRYVRFGLISSGTNVGNISVIIPGIVWNSS